MEWKAAPPEEAFAEALAVPAMLQISPLKRVRVMTFGQWALPMAKLALRYPSTAEVVLVGADAHTVPKDRRARGFARLEDVPKEFRADLVAVAVPGDPSTVLSSLKGHMDPEGLLVVALDQFSRGRVVKDALRRDWKHILPYREFTPPDTALLLLAADRRLGPSLRPFPPNLHRLNPRYMQAMFQLAADEYALLYGAEVA